jgi:hypothetical protein
VGSNPTLSARPFFLDKTRILPDTSTVALQVPTDCGCWPKNKGFGRISKKAFRTTRATSLASSRPESNWRFRIHN